jgi:putative Mg2+ transporter-C (MgtC) family protein
LIILAGIKPLEEAYRSRNQSCQLKIEVESGFLTPESLRATLNLRVSQVKRFIVENRGNQGSDELLVLLNKVSSQDIASFSRRLNELDGVKSVTVLKNKRNGFAGDLEAK